MKTTNKQSSPKKLLHGVRPSRIIYPILIGLAVVVYMLVKEVDANTFSLIEFTWYTIFWLFIALLMMVIRDLGYMARLRILTDRKFSWGKAFRIIMLWEFTSAITPSAIGGTSVAILYLNKEGLKVGRSSAVVMSTSFLDELYFIIMFPLLILLLNVKQLFMIESPEHSIWLDSLLYFALGGYLVKLVYLIVLTYGLFWNPRGLKWLLLWIFKLPVLRKWKHGANKAGSDIIESSKELRRKPFLFWFKAFMATFWSWTARYWVVNAMLLAFMLEGYSFADHIMIFARQLVMWIMMLVSPTPGGSGFSEWVFTQYLGDFLPTAGLAASMALIWRLISYYPYLFIGVYLLPRWIKKHFKNNKS
ncbi:lysylphosphatidylglycerol synthase transmembrane domain-containing protein [Marinifilum flexuosum]|uniref:lysylphosphatidylglycerol synthase transmembrane domain-containing protein n=1 Tax=Marinifilum flexuosum TaxID=1117708 RepID=UPI002493E8CC|nr:lysylphosphatidylglycerol synthase transmembrane domain-containing protein [Marinifilum flexuosum]